MKQSIMEMNRNNFDVYPLAVLEVIDKYLRTEQDNWLERHSVLCDLFESFTKFIAIALIRESSQKSENLSEIFPKGLEFLKHPSLGHWVFAIREILLKSKSEDHWLKIIRAWWKNETPSKNITELYNELPEITFPRGNSQNEGIVNSLVSYRNKVWKGHGAVIVKSDELNKRVIALETLLAELLTTADFLSNIQLFYTKNVQKISNNKFESNSISLNGNKLFPKKYIYEDFEIGEIYLTYETQNELSIKPITLSPLIEFKTNSNGDQRIYFFNDARRTKLEYLSHLDGTFYYHKEIKKELEKLLHISLESSGENFEEILRNYSEEERKERGHTYYLRAKELVSEGKYDSALVVFEESLEWYRTANVIIEMCKTMMILGDEKEYILNNLEYVFEMDPNNTEAKQLSEEIASGKISQNQFNEKELSIEELLKENYVLYDLLVPPKYRTYSMPILLIFVLLLFSISAYFIYLFEGQSNNFNSISPLLMMAQSIIMVIGVYLTKSHFLDSYFGLIGQINNMRVQRFNKWFKTTYDQIFGHFKKKIDKSGNTEITLDFKAEKIFLIFSIAFVIIFSSTAITVQGMSDFPAHIILIHLLLNIIMWILTVPVVRSIIFSTLFIKDYSAHDLFPQMAGYSNNGFSRLVKMYFVNLSLIILFYGCNLIWNLIVVTDKNYYDFLGIGFEVVIFIFWIFLAPIFINRAIKRSKDSLAFNYIVHVKQAFREFVKNPNKSNLEKLDWLKENERQVDELPTGIFSFTKWIYFLFGATVLILGAALYVIIRMDYWKEVTGSILDIIN